MSNRVIITGARAPVALDLGRSFAAAGYRAVFADSVYPFAANWSDVSNEPTIRLPKARQAFPAYQEKISALLSATETPFIMPTCEEVFYVSAAAESVGRESQVFAPPLDTLKTLHSKLLFPAFARSLGITAPETHGLISVEDVANALPAASTCVFKPEYSRFGTQTLIKPHPNTLRDLKPTAEAQWVTQDFVAGEEVCLWVAARNGDLVASTVYRPVWRHGQAASYAFEAIDCPAAIDVAHTLAKACKLTGQLSLDVILTPKGEAIPIECNPRSTSGVHLFDGEADLARAIMGQGAPVHVTAGLRYLWPAMILLGFPHAVMRSRLPSFVADLSRGKDVLTRPGKRLPALGALFDAIRFAALGLPRSKGASRQTTDDIEWNGAPL